MKQIQIVLRRVSPALDLDLAHVGHIQDGQFLQLPLDILSGTPILDYFVTSDISSIPYVRHQSISRLAATLVSYPNFAVDFFDNTLVFKLDFNIDCDEGTSKKKGKGN